MNPLHQNEIFTEKLSYEKGQNKKNSLSNDILYLTDILTGKEFPYNFNLDNVNPEWTAISKIIFIEKFGGYDDIENQTLAGRNGTAKGVYVAIRRFLTWASEHKKDIPLTQWKEEDCRKLIRDTISDRIIINEKEDAIKTPQLLGRGPVNNIYNILKFVRDSYLIGKISDGFSFDLPENFVQKSVSDILADNNSNYEDWLKGNGWSSIPISISMMMLSDAIDTIRSPTAKLLEAYFLHQRSESKCTIKGIFHSNIFDKVCSLTSTPHRLKHYQLLKDSLEKSTGNPISSFPMDHEKLNTHCNEIFDSCLIIFLLLTGVRISELIEISADNYNQEIDGTWVFSSDLIKTNFGLSEVRTMSGLVAEAFSTLINISYVTKSNRPDAQSIPVFGRYFYSSDYNTNDSILDKPRTTSENGIRERLNVWYAKFLDRNIDEFSDLCPTIHPHRFRHTFAEFAVRRFDGNVLEAIRQHYRHQAGSYYTHSYTDNKLSEEVKNSIERNYIKELLEQAVTGASSDDFAGPAAAYAKRMAKNVNYLDPTEIDDFINDLSNEYESLVAHEFGFCLVRKDTRHLAKCLDKKTQIPILENGCFNLCSGCINAMHSKKSNKESITRIALSHQNLLDNFPIKNTAAHKESQAVVKRANIILSEMEE